jgi:hypothetical protein
LRWWAWKLGKEAEHGGDVAIVPEDLHVRRSAVVEHAKATSP